MKSISIWIKVMSDTCMIYLDASKAFDQVWQKGLVYKLGQLGLAPTLLQWFQSYLHELKISTVVDREQSTWAHIQVGVPQGSIIGNLLFLIYINDIVNDISSNILLYADDTSRRQKIDRTHPQAAFDVLNQDLPRLAKWAKT
jgi:hypothetical protein